ncbi:hypothetical protein LXL04_003353 [Taraxacum kok-saghyz]
MKETESIAAPLIATADFSQPQTGRFNTRSSSDQSRSHNTSRLNSENQSRNSRSNTATQYRNNRSSSYCHFCAIPGHETHDCRKLARFLKDYNITYPNTSNHPVANNTTSSSKSTPATAPWLFDSGASHHLTSDRSSLHTVSEYGGPDEILLGDGTTFSISHIGHTNLPTATRSLRLSNVLCVPNLRKNLISVAKLCRTNNVSVEFFPLYFLIKDLCTGAPLMRGENINDVYYANRVLLPQLNNDTKVSPLDFHHTLRHPSAHLGLNFKSMSKLNFHCPSCSVNKSHKLPFGQNSFTADKPLQLIYSDVWGPVQKSIDGFAYYVVFVDYYSKYIWLYPIKFKSDVSKIFPQFKLLVEKYFNTSIISMFTDNGGEYQALIPLFKSMGISHYTTAQHTPEQNGIAERRHRHIVETGLALLHYVGLPLTFWSHAFQTAVYLINRLPTPILNAKSPFDLMYGRSPNYTKLKPFGCLCYPWLRPYSTSKLHPRSTPCLFLGYSTDKSAYKCLHIDTHRIYHSRHVEFIDNNFPYKTSQSLSTSLPTVDEFFTHSSPPLPTSPTLPVPNNILDATPVINTHFPHKMEPYVTIDPTSPIHSEPNFDSSSPTSPTRSIPSPTPSPSPSPTPSSPLPPRQRKPNPKYFNPMFVNTATTHPIPVALEPTTHNQASKDPLWRKAMDDEYNALIQNST